MRLGEGNIIQHWEVYPGDRHIILVRGVDRAITTLHTYRGLATPQHEITKSYF